MGLRDIVQGNHVGVCRERRLSWIWLFRAMTMWQSHDKLRKGISVMTSSSLASFLFSNHVILVGFEPLAHADRIHHILLYGCSEPAHSSAFWKGGETCGSGPTHILYAWARNGKFSFLIFQSYNFFFISSSESRSSEECCFQCWPRRWWHQVFCDAG